MEHRAVLTFEPKGDSVLIATLSEKGKEMGKFEIGERAVRDFLDSKFPDKPETVEQYMNNLNK